MSVLWLEEEPVFEPQLLQQLDEAAPTRVLQPIPSPLKEKVIKLEQELCVFFLFFKELCVKIKAAASALPVEEHKAARRRRLQIPMRSRCRRHNEGRPPAGPPAHRTHKELCL